MTFEQRSFAQLSDEALLAVTMELAERERYATAALIGVLMELDKRKLYLGEGCTSLFSYCTCILHLSEHAAYHRIAAARAAQQYPEILERLSDGSLTLTAVRLLSPYLTGDNRRALLDSARHRSKRDIEHMVAALAPKPAVPSSVRKLPVGHAAAVVNPVAGPSAPDPATEEAAVVIPPARLAPPRPMTIPLAPDRYKVQFTVNRETYDKLRRVQDLLRHSVPDGDPAVVFDKALTLLLEDLERRKCAATSRPRAGRQVSVGSRHIPAAVRRDVWKRDGARCAFVGTNGRCAETGFLEFHHVVPFAEGGPSTADNIQLRCAAHNAYEATAYFADREPPLFRETTMPWTARDLVRTESLPACPAATP